ncbi:hypothetical protein D1867_07345 [Acidianus infernus]|uniref:Uncharacterized protein n=1 Tax=Acidianus infernus TaxID=12915 RepID=A0A6A9QFU7_ACIIN|nr:hypothetical protein [Acidianus infernus]MUM65054.1 hypothetical protein [Acidianus infernus]
MSWILRKYFFKEIFDEIEKDLALDPEILRLIMPVRYPQRNGVEELKKMIRELGIEDIEIKESKEPIDERRRAAAISSNMSPINIEDPVEVLWKIAERFKGDGLGNRKSK